MKNKANVDATADDGTTPLMSAVSFMSMPETVRVLLSAHPKIDAVNSKGQTALMIAAENVRLPQIIQLLLDAHANAKLEDNTGRTALDWFDLNTRINKSPVRKQLKEAM